MGRNDFSDQFRKIIIRHKRIGYDLNVMRQSACLVINPITVENFIALFNCTPVDRVSDSMMARPKAIHFCWLGPELSSVAWSTGALLMIFVCFRFPVVLFGRLSHNTMYLLSHRLCFFILLKRDLIAYRDDSLTF